MITITIMIIDMVKITHFIRLIPTLPRTSVMTEQILVVICPDFSRMQRNHEVLSTTPWLRPTTGWPTGNGPAVMAIMSTMMFPISTWVRVIMIRQTQGSVGASYVEITASLPNWIHTSFDLRPCALKFSVSHSRIRILSSVPFPSSIRSHFSLLLHAPFDQSFQTRSTAFFPYDK
jgi:hypothetical protein